LEPSATANLEIADPPDPLAVSPPALAAADPFTPQ
jgi:hypothetical protein